MPVKGQGTINRQIAITLARIHRKAFLKNIYNNFFDLYDINTNGKNFSIPLVSFSSERDVPEQVLSILSFLHHCGVPKKWTIYSDGSHTEQSQALLMSNFPFIEMKYIPFNNISRITLKLQLQPYEDCLAKYAIKHPLGKKLLCFLNHPVNEPTIFLDSDIVFYEQAKNLELINEYLHTGAFMPDYSWGSLDEHYLLQHRWELYHTNSGFFWACNEMNPEEGLKHLKSLQNKHHYFSEQTTFHIIFKTNRFIPLDPRLFYVSTSDQFQLGYNFKRQDLMLRHYTNPVRYKMWQRNWKWHLSIK